jgi:hypothetical protein
VLSHTTSLAESDRKPGVDRGAARALARVAACENPATKTATEAGLAFELILKMSGDDGAVRQVSLGEICRTEVHDVALLGLGLSESKLVLARLQREIVTRQFESTTRERRPCVCCGATPSIKDYQRMRFRSLFGDVDLHAARYVKCACAASGAGQHAPRRRWVSAELEGVQSELAASLSYRRSAQVLRMLLPIGHGHSASTVRARTLRVGERLEAKLTAVAELPGTQASIVTTVGLDGGYVRHCDAETAHSFEIIAGRVLAKDGSQRSVGFVRSLDESWEGYFSRASGRTRPSRFLRCSAVQG